MFYFKKKIAYFDYYESGEKKRSCGHTKLLIKDERVTIEIHVKDVGAKESCMCDILAVGQKESRIGRFVMDRGTGYYNAHYQRDDLDGEGLSLFETEGLKLRISEDKYCQTAWEWGKLSENKTQQIPRENVGELPVAQTRAALETETEQEEAVTLATEAKRNATAAEPARRIQEKKELQDGEAADSEEAKSEDKTVEKEESAQETEEKTESVEEKELKTEELLGERLHEDKWQQLCSTYPVCHPFGDAEEYIAIAPKDFVVLRKEYQNLVSNSFLMHSFYNYHHVILGKMEKNDEIYYIGAPGNYFDRDRKVAVMFGFEGFARSETGNKQRNENSGVTCGDFGYYMKKVEI